MKTITVGETYQLKNGMNFKCDEHRPEQNNYPYGGKVYRIDGSFDRIAYYTQSGIYNIQATSDYDFSTKQ